MNLKKLGKTGTLVSDLCLGTMTFGWQADEQESHRILDKFTESGGNFIDALNLAGIKKHIFLEKEGVAFINGTSAISGILAVAIHDARKLMAQSIAASRSW